MEPLSILLIIEAVLGVVAFFAAAMVVLEELAPPNVDKSARHDDDKFNPYDTHDSTE